MTVQSYEISDDDIKKIKKISSSEDRNKSQIVRGLIREYWKKYYGGKDGKVKS